MGLRGAYNWQLLDGLGAAGTGFDQVAITGTLFVNSGFSVNLWSLAAINPDSNGNALNFDGNQNASWVIATSGGLQGVDNLPFVTVNTGAINGTGGLSNPVPGTFTLAQGDGVTGTVNDVVLVYTVPEPSLVAVAIGVAAGAWALGRRTRRRAARPGAAAASR